MIHHKLAFGNVLVSLSVFFLIFCMILCGAEAADQKAAPAAQPQKTVSTPPPIDLLGACKSQLQACQTELQAITREKDALQKTNKDLLQKNADFQKKIDEFTKLGGSSVKAYCKSGTVSANTAGATSDCSSTGYMCEPVSGLCRTKCSATAGQCASGFVCDTMYGQCIRN
jgi:hypothetical protein